MRYVVGASIVVVVIACLTISSCYALNAYDNGYKWNSSDVTERGAFCKSIAGYAGKNYSWWIGEFNKWYDTTDPYRLNQTLGEVEDLFIEFIQMNHTAH